MLIKIFMFRVILVEVRELVMVYVLLVMILEIIV